MSVYSLLPTITRRRGEQVWHLTVKSADCESIGRAELRQGIGIKLMGTVVFKPISALSRVTMIEICRRRSAGTW